MAEKPPPSGPPYTVLETEQPPPPAVQVVTQPVVVVQQQPVFRDLPVIITDSKGQQVETVLEYHVGTLTWIAVGCTCLLLVGFGLCCFAFIPLFINALKDVYHINPTDGTVVGVYRRTD